MATSIQQLEDVWFTDIFPKNSKDDFLQRCCKREESIKTFLGICWKEILLHTETPSLTKKELTGWRTEKIKKNLKNWLLYLDELVSNLQKQKIEQYVTERQQRQTRTLIFEPDALLLTFNSYYGTVLSDIFWIGDLTVADVVHISKRELDLGLLGKHVDGQMTKIETLLSGHQSLYTKHHLPFEGIEEAFKCHKNRYYKAFNLLMIATIEGIVRSFGEHLISKQNIENGKPSHSLAGFMTNTPWINDLTINKTQYFQITGDYNHGDRKTNFLNPRPVKETIAVSYPQRLDFLGKGFKERRNTLAHGGQVTYEDTLQSLINAAALVEVLETIVEYRQIYQD